MFSIRYFLVSGLNARMKVFLCSNFVFTISPLLITVFNSITFGYKRKAFT